MTDFLQNMAAVAAPVSLLVTIVVVAWAAIQQGNMKTLRDSNADLRNRVGDLEAERKDDDAKAEQRETLITQLRAENDLLKQINTGQVNWAEISDLLEHHHQASNKHWDLTQQTLQLVLDELKRHPSASGGLS